MKRICIFAMGFFATLIVHAQTNDLNVQLMQATVRIQGPATVPGKNAEGTVFFLSYPIPDNTNWGWNIMVTAAHVLDDIKSDNAVLYLRKPVNANFEKLPCSIQIKADGKPLWYKHPDVDIAVMIANLKKEYLDCVQFFPVKYVADDKTWEERFIHPGDEIFCLGYPLGLESSAAGFPLLRSGRIASFPLLPTKAIKTFQLDLRVFGGNSGGPVYFQFYGRRRYTDFKSPEVDCFGLLGVMIQDVSYVQSVEGYFESTSRRDPLGIAVVVHASFVKEAIETLIAEKQKKEHPTGSSVP